MFIFSVIEIFKLSHTLSGLLLLVLCCLKFSGILTNILTLTGAVLVYYYRTQTGDVTFPGFHASQLVYFKYKLFNTKSNM